MVPGKAMGVSTLPADGRQVAHLPLVVSAQNSIPDADEDPSRWCGGVPPP